MAAVRRAGNSHSPILDQQNQVTYADGEVEDSSGADEVEDLDNEETYSEGSSSLEIPNESIDFDVVYSLRHFVATVEGQASVAKGDAMCLMDDSNSYWWLVRVLRSDDVGYIPAENIETPIERLARLNKHRNVDLASATQAERDAGGPSISARRVHNTRRIVHNGGAHRPKSVVFAGDFTIHNYPPAVWTTPRSDGEGGEVDDEMDDEGEESWNEEDQDAEAMDMDTDLDEMEPDDGIAWANEALEAASASPPNAVQDVASTAAGPRRHVVRIEEPSVDLKDQPSSTLQSSNKAASQRSQLGVGLAPGLRQNQDTPRERSISDPLSALSVRTDQHSMSAESGILDPSVQSSQRLSPNSTASRVAAATRQIPGGSGGVIAPTKSSAILEQQRLVAAQQEQAVRERQASQDGVSSRVRTTSDASTVGKRSRDDQSSDSQQPESKRPRGKEDERQPRKLRKEPSEELKDRQDKEKEESAGKKKKSGGVFSGLFSRKKEKEKEKEKDKDKPHKRVTSSDSVDSFGSRPSEDADVASDYPASPPEPTFRMPSPMPKRSNSLTSSQQAHPNTPSLTSISTAATSPSPSTQASSRLVQQDKEQQELYAQYLASTQPGSRSQQAFDNYATQSAAAVAQSGAAARLQHATNSPLVQKPNRPGSLVLTSAVLPDVVTELSVLRVFAGEDIASEATFKTVLLNPSTTAEDLVKQAVQRFRLAEEEMSEYYLTVKQAEGGEAELMDDEKPLVVFEELSAIASPPSIAKRSSLGSINSVASNLSTLPMIAKLGMSDFTDDSRVKFYLNRRRPADEAEAAVPDDRILGSITEDSGLLSTSTSGGLSPEPHQNTLDTSLSFSSASNSTRRMSTDRFSSSSARFALQTIIQPSDLPDGMVFDPATEAIVYKSTLAHRSLLGAAPSPGISQTERKKVFVFARNATVAEVIETALDRFGIAEGMVDGGDDVEDRVMKRRSVARVRYGLSVLVDGEERALQPSSKIIDAFPRQPAFKIIDRRSIDSKRRSNDDLQIVGSLEDIHPEDPIFVLRRAGGGLRTSGSSRHSRHSVPLDDVALARLQAEKRASVSMSSSSDRASGVADSDTAALSRQEIIREQRAQSRARQHGLLTAQTSDHGVDLLLPDRSRLRSIKKDNKMRYSYVQADGEAYDISNIIEEELRSENDTVRMSSSTDGAGTAEDLLEEVLQDARGKPNSKAVLEERLDRVLTRVKENRHSLDAMPSSPLVKRLSTASSRSGSSYNEDGQRNPRIDTAVRQSNSSPSPSSGRSTPTESTRRPGAPGGPRQLHQRQQPSIASVLSDLSLYDAGSSAPGSPHSPISMTPPSAALVPTKKPIMLTGDFGLSDMLALIQLKASLQKPPPPPPLSKADALLFGPKLDPSELHPAVKDLFEPHLRSLEEYDKRLDRLLLSTIQSQ